MTHRAKEVFLIKKYKNNSIQILSNLGELMEMRHDPAPVLPE